MASPETPLKCPQCGRTYKMKRNLNTHMRFECGGQRNFTCHICPAKYTQNIGLRRHLLQKHNTYLPPKFSVPKQSAAARGSRNGYFRNTEAFTCHQCGRSYQMRHNLVKHLRFECGGHKHFACSLCPARYTQNGKLRQHMLNAHNIFKKIPPLKKKEQSFCERYAVTDFSSMKIPLVEAMDVTEDREFQCLTCGKKYSLKHNLTRHIRYECGGQRRFSCVLCPKKYTQNTTLQKHLIRYHNILVPQRRYIPRFRTHHDPLSNVEN
ncbi:zinc finger X-chromosomal protein-like [Nomia melanderi]|uniref:zinc finger X-chromosomal protein-like n=1 Tax=Nomia melanderi TaxID=2448451 RepID=UPI003FCC8288